MRLDAFFGKVDVSFDMSDRPEEMASNFFDLLPEASGELFLGGAQGQRRAGSYDIHDRLGLGEVHLAVEKGPSREFARLSRASPRAQNRLEQTRRDQHTSMAVEFCHIFSGVAAWRAKNDSHALIQLPSLIAKAAKVQTALQKAGGPGFLVRKAALRSREQAIRKCE